jgi:superfamily II DNA or RNA helicase
MQLIKSKRYVEVPDKEVFPVYELPAGHPWAGGLVLPRFALKHAGEHLVMSQEKLYDGDDIQGGLAPHIKLRDYQSDAVSAAVNQGHGVIQAPCGAGKTGIGVGIISQVSRKTLVLLHTGDLARQWRERIEEWMPQLRVGIRGMGKNEDGDVVIATVQTLCRMPWAELYEWASQFGVCILDEAHHGPATTYIQVMGAIPSRIRIALTATPKRKDGLELFIHMMFGETVWSIGHGELESRGLIAIPKVYEIRTSWAPAGSLSPADYSRVINQLTENKGRNRLIMDIVKKAHKEGRSILVLSDRVGHCVDMAETARGLGIESYSLVGPMKPTARSEVIQRARDGDVRVIFATQLADEGMDITRLDTLIMCVPSSSMGKVEQRVGRIMRPHPEKKSPVVFDIQDAWPSFRGGANKRRRLYRKLNMGMSVLEVSYENNYDKE